MKTSRLIEVVSVTLILLGVHAMGQNATTNLSASTSTNPPPASEAVTNETEKSWSVSVSAYTYVVPDDHNYVQPTIAVDYERLHLELRYNYEALKTGSAWIGCNFSGGEKVTWELTPMVGAVFGDLTGVAPGYKGSVSWWKLELYSEGEYVFDPGNSSNNFFYNWSELSLRPIEWFRVGMVTQRTRAYQTDREVQRGLLVGFTYKRLDFTTYVFNPDDHKPTWVLALGLNF
jgi:hypothetical protein